jgi:phosphoserine phosphatase
LPEAIFFDMDDTILAEDVVCERCWQQVCDTFASCIAALGVNAADMLVSLRDARHWYWRTRIAVLNSA